VTTGTGVAVDVGDGVELGRGRVTCGERVVVGVADGVALAASISVGTVVGVGVGDEVGAAVARAAVGEAVAVQDGVAVGPDSEYDGAVGETASVDGLACQGCHHHPKATTPTTKVNSRRSGSKAPIQERTFPVYSPSSDSHSAHLCAVRPTRAPHT
jgi:hypothetical protein